MAVLDDCIVEAVAQPLDVGGGGAYVSVVVVIDNLREGVDAAHQRLLAVLKIQAGDAAQGVDKGQNVIVLAISQVEMRHLLVGEPLVAEVEAAHLGVEVGRHHDQRNVVVGRGLAGDARMLRIEYGEVVGREPLEHRVVLHVDVAAVAQRDDVVRRGDRPVVCLYSLQFDNRHALTEDAVVVQIRCFMHIISQICLQRYTLIFDKTPVIRLFAKYSVLIV